eukprot:UN20440
MKFVLIFFLYLFCCMYYSTFTYFLLLCNP